jgi:hypothetical protein
MRWQISGHRKNDADQRGGAVIIDVSTVRVFHLKKDRKAINVLVTVYR